MHKRAEKINVPFKDIVIMASIIEREAVKPEEKSAIAAVFYNRLRKKMRLQSCATVLYAIETNKARLALENMKFDSSYNTLMNI